MSNQLTASTSSLTKSITDELPPSSHLFTQNHSSAKRSVSVMATVRPSPSKNDEANPLHSKSASNMKDLGGSGAETSQKTRYQSMYEQNKPNTSPSGLSSGYKYTPLRQSWSNLSQMHQLSPYSLTPNTDNSVNRRTLVEENGNLSSDENNGHISPALSSRSARNRPHTADSSSFRNTASRANKENDDDFDKEDENYVYVDDYEDNEQLNEDANGNAYFKKYRTQNIRIKRTTPKLLQNQNVSIYHIGVFFKYNNWTCLYEI